MEGSSVSTDAGITRDEQPEISPTVELVCSICIASPTNPILTSCGHLFCWPCLHRWLQAQPKPCPVCRTMLRTDINITPIYGSADGSSVGSAAGAHAGQTDASENAIPPRPNPRAPSARVQAEVALGRNGFLTLRVVKAAFDVLERVHESLRTELVERLNVMQLEIDAIQLERDEMEEERDKMREDLIDMRRERSELQQNMNDVVHRNVVLGREAKVRDRRHLGLAREADERARRHLHERNKMEERIASLQNLVARCNRPLQQTVNDLVGRNMVLTRQVEERDRRHLEMVREAEERERRHFEERTRKE